MDEGHNQLYMYNSQHMHNQCYYAEMHNEMFNFIKIISRAIIR